ncbi:MAG: PIN domain nuclease [Betaproteobacteria bacterium]|nr:PIN domain nuclease [Betaproteobacteria bacterium]
MILVDSSVWIDYFRGAATPQAEKLESLLGTEPIATGDLILTEVLQGFVSDRDFNQARKLLTSLVVVDLAGQDIAIQAAKNFRALRALGVSVRKTIDTVIATRCIESGLPLLYSDRDFDPFVEHLGLRSALPGAQIQAR